TGQGPDELFGGYRRHLGVHYGAAWANLPHWLHRPITAAVTRLPRNETIKRGVQALAVADRLKRYQHVLSILPGADVNALFRAEVIEANAGDAIVDSWGELTELMNDTDELGGFQYLELRSTLPDE